MEKLPITIIANITKFLGLDDTYTFTCSFGRAWRYRASLRKPLPIMTIHTIPVEVVPELHLDNPKLLAGELETAWKWLNSGEMNLFGKEDLLDIVPVWGDEIHFDCETYRSFGIFYTDGTKIIVADEVENDDYGVMPDSFYVLEDGRPLDYWSERHSMLCRIRPGQKFTWDKDFVYFGKKYRIAVFNEYPERITITDKNIDRVLKICSAGILLLRCEDYEGLVAMIKE